MLVTKVVVRPVLDSEFGPIVMLKRTIIKLMIECGADDLSGAKNTENGIIDIITKTPKKNCESYESTVLRIPTSTKHEPQLVTHSETSDWFDCLAKFATHPTVKPITKTIPNHLQFVGCVQHTMGYNTLSTL